MSSARNFLQGLVRSSSAVLLSIVFFLVFPYRASSDDRDIMAAQLAARSESLRLEDPASLEVSALLAIESLKLHPSAEGDHALRSALSLLRRPSETLQHEKAINSVAVSRNGLWIGTAGDDNRAQIGNTSTLEIFTVTHAHPVTSVAFSPDGKLAATGSQSVVKLFDLDKKVELTPPLNVHEKNELDQLPNVNERISTIVFSEDNRLLAMVTASSLGVVYSMDNKRKIFEMSFKKGLRSIGLDGAKKHLIAADGDVVRTFDLAHNNQELPALNLGHVRMIALDHSREYLATAGDDGMAYLVNTKTGTKVPLAHPDLDEARMRRAHDPLTALAFSADGKLLATGSANGMVRVYRVTGECKEVSHFSHQGPITAVAFLASNKVVSASADRTARVFNASTGRELARLVHPGPVMSLGANENSETVVTASGDIARLFRISRAVDTDALEKQIEIGQTAFSSLNGRLAISTREDTHVFDSTNGKEISNDLKSDYKINRLALSADGQFMAMTKLFGATHITQIFDSKKEYQKGKNPRQIANSDLDQKTVAALAFSADSQQLIIVGNSTRAEDSPQAYLLRFNPVKGDEIGSIKTCPGKAQSAAVSYDHRFSAIGTSEHACVFDFGQTPRQFNPIDRTVTAIAFSPDNHFVAMGTPDGFIYAYSLTGKSVFSSNPVFVSEKHETAITALIFAGDSHTLSSQTAGGILRLFDLSQNKNKSTATIRLPEQVKASGFVQNTLVTLAVGEDGAFVQRHLLAPTEIIEQGCAVVTRNLFKDERRAYLGSAAYPETCVRATLPGWK